LIHRQLVEVDHPPYRPPAQVHEGQGLDEQDRLVRLLQLRDERLELLPERRATRRGGEVVDHLETNVVPRARVLRTRIAETDDDLHDGQSRRQESGYRNQNSKATCSLSVFCTLSPYSCLLSPDYFSSSSSTFFSFLMT